MEAAERQAAAEPLPSQLQAARRQLMLRDGLRFLTLTAFAVVLAAVTAFLFRSFESHREQLAEERAAYGRAALAKGHAAEAVSALRTALTFRDNRGDELTLARALEAAGHRNEAENYFLNLWQAQPGDGPINLELARLNRTAKKPIDAIGYYRAGVFGTWPGNAPEARRDTRLELAGYLVSLRQYNAAAAELLIAAGNNPDPESQLRIGEALEAAKDDRSALTAYRNATQDPSLKKTADARTGELCFRRNDYSCAEEHLADALRGNGFTPEQRLRMTTMQHDADRLRDLNWSRDLPASVRSAHLTAGARIAQERVKTCQATLPQDDRKNLDAVNTAWKQLDTLHDRAALQHDDDLQERFREQIVQSENEVSAACGAPTGDDALLLYLNGHPATKMGTEP